LAGVHLELTSSYGRQHQKFGPWTTNDAGIAKVILVPGFYSLHLRSDKEWPFLPVDEHYNHANRGPSPTLDLLVTDSSVEKWLGGRRRDAGNQGAIKSSEPPSITYTLLPACELVLRAVDAATGQGLAGAEFDEENAVGEEWGHPIYGENLGSKFTEFNRQVAGEAYRTGKDGNFRRLVGANAGFKYGVTAAPVGYELVAPGLDIA
jgi:hypothetical protein